MALTPLTKEQIAALALSCGVTEAAIAYRLVDDNRVNVMNANQLKEVLRQFKQFFPQVSTCGLCACALGLLTTCITRRRSYCQGANQRWQRVWYVLRSGSSHKQVQHYLASTHDMLTVSIQGCA
jgi:hypothetical protein